MDLSRLQKMGLTVRRMEHGEEVELELVNVSLVNPISRQFLNKVTFSVAGDRLVPIDPPEMLGMPPVLISSIERTAELESQIEEAFNAHIFQIQRRSSELVGLGLSPHVDPASLQLTTRVEAGDLVLILGTDKRGNFRILEVTRAGQAVPVPPGQSFELSEFREKGALVGYLTALFPLGQAPKPDEKAVKEISFGELSELFGPLSLLPAGSGLEILMRFRVEGEIYRFAAARVAGRSFRGLIAGSKGKVWAERFDLDSFPGAKAHLAKVLGVAQDKVEALES